MRPAGLEFLARARPTRALRLLRETRSKGVRSWDDEYEVERIYAAAMAMEALNRHGQALHHYRRVVSMHVTWATKPAQQRIDALEGN
ncbi:MAG: hypothetical protein GC159_20605 [Phycisphaera sp.]|nr:hypothetical protein [Phycisphaera sp.]